MSNQLKKKLKANLPYWPSKAFLDESIKILRKKGMTDTDRVLEDMILQAYWQKRNEILGI